MEETVSRLKAELDDQASLRTAELEKRAAAIGEKAREFLAGIIMSGDGDEG